MPLLPNDIFKVGQDIWDKRTGEFLGKVKSVNPPKAQMAWAQLADDTWIYGDDYEALYSFEPPRTKCPFAYGHRLWYTRKYRWSGFAGVVIDINTAVVGVNRFIARTTTGEVVLSDELVRGEVAIGRRP